MRINEWRASSRMVISWNTVKAQGYPGPGIDDPAG